MDKRTFIKQFSLLSAGSVASLNAFSSLVDEHAHVPLDELAEDEDFWQKVREGYKLKTDYINLENGYYCFMPEETLDSYLKHVKYVNLHASFYMRKLMGDNHKKIRQKLADLAGCSLEEIVVTRNSTEALDLVISGIHWSEGDEAIMAEQDYGAMLNQFVLMEKRYGIVNKKVSLPNHPKNDEEIISLYEKQITDKTKLIMICHMVNISGQVLPVKKICDMAHKHGVEVLVDGAHSFAHIDFKVPDLGCDYFGTSLHKWLSTPLGAGFLYVKKEKIKNLWPIFGERELPEDDIMRLNHTGTKPVHVDLGISNAIDFHNTIGGERKEKRLRFLKEYWTNKVKDNPKIIINTPWQKERYGAIASVLIEGMTAREIEIELFDKYNIHVVRVKRPNVHGCRVTPSLYTSTDDLDKLVAALEQMAG
jgi:selenocysteine lyase/cysteine desulfurase